MCKGGLAISCISTKLQAFDVMHVVDLLFRENEVKWKFFAVYFVGYACEVMGEDVSVLRVSVTRGVYSRFLDSKKVVPLIEQKLGFLALDFPVIWEKVSNSFVCPDLRNLKWRVLHDVLPVNEKLHRQQSFVSPFCPLCRVGVESLQHIFLGCPVVVPVLNRVEAIIARLLNRPSAILTVNEVVYLLPPLAAGRLRVWR